MSAERALRLVPDAPKYVMPSHTSDALLTLWAEWQRAAGASTATIRTRVQGIEGLMSHSGNPDPVTFTSQQVVSWLARCKSPHTRSTYFHTARAWHRFLLEQELRSDNPMTRVPKPKEARGAPRPVPDEVLTAMLDHPVSTRGYAYTVLAALQGLRVHEIAQVAGADFDGQWMHVNGKGGSDAAIPTHPLTEQLRRGMPAASWWFPSTTELGHVRGRSVSLTLTRSLRAAGSTATPHALRHWFGTQLMRNGADLRTVQELLRHSSLTSTAIYTEVSGLAKQAAIGRLAAVRHSAGPD